MKPRGRRRRDFMRRYVWGIDIGGTKCALVSGDDAGNVLFRREIRTRECAGWREVLGALFEALPEQRPEAVGISCGGPLDAARGLILSPPNLPGWDEVPIVGAVSGRFGVPAFLQNDANACALAEWRFGAGRGARNMVFLTFGTGFGAGLILDGKLYSGTNDMAGEIGHVRCEPDGPVGYGKAGSFEGFCSGGGIEQLSAAERARGRRARRPRRPGDARCAPVERRKARAVPVALDRPAQSGADRRRQHLRARFATSSTGRGA